jgi:hypothetical protein
MKFPPDLSGDSQSGRQILQVAPEIAGPQARPFRHVLWFSAMQEGQDAYSLVGISP